jgi:hypothetical protein
MMGTHIIKQEDGLLTRGNNKQLYPTEDEDDCNLFGCRRSTLSAKFLRESIASTPFYFLSFNLSSNEDHCLALAT